MGEEISWGQRIFGFDTPESIKELNYQEEFTIHNLQFIYDIFTSSKTGIFGQNAFFLFMFIVGVMFPLAAYVPWGRLLIQRIAFPVIPACYSLLFLGALFYGKYMQDFSVSEFWAKPSFLPFRAYATRIVCEEKGREVWRRLLYGFRPVRLP